ncbi:hypothetical protein Hypma_016070 [Hypsizygus marmoreus]|uniref:Uncharacterized protein n=1 Tax=Hypsizygus marmoreus TaxID=39966 RepID=A0A369K1Z5_HYPMA|nr:hypothetical protein Hypma_016070 [Hypsizygus marmoreus]
MKFRLITANKSTTLLESRPSLSIINLLSVDSPARPKSEFQDYGVRLLTQPLGERETRRLRSVLKTILLRMLLRSDLLGITSNRTFGMQTHLS